ncbi:SDR family NAD(P)-dependent oxidoreductase [Phytohabitans kaempferiae]|uniref:SDR family NAD(P)-dependent oxidoreductase n=1 Tax=Phytohabitans kaempferiae TaxID=1620943 RepID=A0ABV6LY67_9ACTN
MNLEDRVAVVTGGASGLGFAVAQRLAAQGATVIITDIDQAAGSQASKQLDATFVAHDVADETSWQNLCQVVRQKFGPLNVLVNNAGVVAKAEAADPEHQSLAEWHRLFAVNSDGVFLGCKTAIGAMREAGGGAIINVSSVAALLATPFGTAYGATKAVVAHLTRTVAQYCAREKLDVRCNSIHPGDIRTPLWDQWATGLATERGVTFEAIVAEFEGMIPTGRMTTPEDIAASVAFLASDEARQINGAQIVVDGGFVSCNTYALTTSGGPLDPHRSFPASDGVSLVHPPSGDTSGKEPAR